jgi:hypothetical protein
VNGRSRELGATLRGGPEELGPAVAGIGNPLQVTGLDQLGDQLAHGLMAHPGALGQRRQPATGRIDGLEHLRVSRPQDRSVRPQAGDQCSLQGDAGPLDGSRHRPVRDRVVVQ